MDTPTTKDYIDARLETVNGEIRTLQFAMTAGFERLEQLIRSETQSVRDEVSIKLAQSDAQVQKVCGEIAKSQSEIIKWVVGALFTSSALTISTVSFLLSQTPPKSSAPIVIYAQPPAAATPPPAPGR
jgi:hypothetical protein